MECPQQAKKKDITQPQTVLNHLFSLWKKNNTSPREHKKNKHSHTIYSFPSSKNTNSMVVKKERKRPSQSSEDSLKTCPKKPYVPKAQQKVLKETGFSPFIFQITRNLQPNVNLSTRSMFLMNEICSYLLEEIGKEASQLVKYKNKKSIGTEEIKQAIKRLFSEDLAEGCLMYGNEVLQYSKAINATNK